MTDPEDRTGETEERGEPASDPDPDLVAALVARGIYIVPRRPRQR